MKYIIDVPDTQEITYYAEYKMVSLKVNEGIVASEIYIDAEPYIEPDHKVIEDEVWGFVNFLENKLMASDYDDIFDDNSPYDHMSYQEAKSKFEAWKKDEIRVGDEVTSEYGDGVVLDIVENVIHILGKDGICNEYAEGEYTKTGRHFDEVEELLEKMRGES